MEHEDEIEDVNDGESDEELIESVYKFLPKCRHEKTVARSLQRRNFQRNQQGVSKNLPDFDLLNFSAHKKATDKAFMSVEI